MKKLWIYIAVTFILGIIFVYTFSENASDYKKKVENDWEEKELALLNDSPPVIEKRLNVFPPDEDFRVVAEVKHIQLPKKIDLNTSDGKTRRYSEYCRLIFFLKGKEYQLIALLPEDSQELFVAFTDETTGKETYAAGRFLPIEIKDNAVNTILDFNYAYNPYCAYNVRYSCPLPLPENHLSIRIEAGEKVYKKAE